MCKFIFTSLIVSFIFALTSCGGGGGSSSVTPVAKPQTPSNITQTFGRDSGAQTCNVQFIWDQPDYDSAHHFGVTYIIKQDSSVFKQITTPIAETATTHNTLPAALSGFTNGATYTINLTAKNDGGLSSPSAAHSFTPVCDQTPQAPTMAATNPVITSCKSGDDDGGDDDGCTATFNWNQSDYISGYQTRLSVFTSAGTRVKSYTVNETGTTNNTAATGYVLKAGTTYYATLETINGSNHSTDTKTSNFTPTYTPPAVTGNNGIWLSSVQDDLSNCSGSGCTSNWMTSSLFQSNRVNYIYPDFVYFNTVPDSSAFWSGSTFNAAGYIAKYICTTATSCSAGVGGAGILYFAGGGSNIIPGAEVTASYKNWNEANSTKVIPIVDLTGGTTGSSTIINANTASDDIKAAAIALGTVINDDPNAAGVGFDEEPKLSGAGAELFLTNLAQTLSQKNKLLVIWGTKANFCDTYNGNACVSTAPALNVWNIMNTYGGIAMLGAYDSSGSTIAPNTPTSYGTNISSPMGSFARAAQTNITNTSKATFQIAIPASATATNWAYADAYNYSDNPFGSNYSGVACPNGDSNCVRYTPNTPYKQRDYSCQDYQLINYMFYGGSKTFSDCNAITPAYSMPTFANTNIFSGVVLYHLGPPTLLADQCAGKSTECITPQPESLLLPGDRLVDSWPLFITWASTHT